MNFDQQFVKTRHSFEPDDVEKRRQIGSELQSAREFHEMSREQIVSVTKINVKYLDSIEQGDWSFLPPVYVKLFVKAYAETVGKYDREFAERLNDCFTKSLPSVKWGDLGDGTARNARSQPRGSLQTFMHWVDQNRSILFYALISIVVVILGLVYVFQPTDNRVPYQRLAGETEKTPAEPEVALESDTTALAAAADTITTAPPTVAATKSEPPPARYQLAIAAVETCYVKITSGETLVYEATLWPRNRYANEFENPVRIALGNAPGARIIVNGDTLEPFPRGRRVRMITVGKDGFVD